MKLIEMIMKNNPCYKARKTITVKGLMLHSVGCPQPSASVFISSWNKESYSNACVHGFIDANDGTFYQTLPWNYRGWHCGGTANGTHIGVEMCEPSCIRYTGGATFTCSDKKAAQKMVKRTYEAAVELFAMLCTKYGLNPTADGVIISHSEGAKRGIASNHGDPEHLWKQLETGYTMDGFRKDVKSKMENTKSEVKTESSATKASKDFMVKVSIPDLNIRKGPGTNYEKTEKFTGVGSFTITEVKSGTGSKAGWGKLKSGTGWISLDYAKKV